MNAPLNLPNHTKTVLPHRQETAVTAIGMVLGMMLTGWCTGSPLSAWLWFLALTVLHVWANLRAMRCLVLTSINQPRLDALLEEYAANVRSR